MNKTTHAHSNSSLLRERETSIQTNKDSRFKNLLRNVGSANETWSRTLARTASWRFFGSMATSILVAMQTSHMVNNGYFHVSSKTLAAGLTVGGAELIAKPFFQLVHDRVWTYIKWGYKFVIPKK
jgi:hypothetical protein